MNVKYVLGKSVFSSDKGKAIEEITRKLGNRAKISGDNVEVDSFKEREFEDILKRFRVSYTRK